MGIISLGGMKKVPHDLNELLDEASSLWDEGVVEITVKTSEKDVSGYSMSHSKKIVIDLHDRENVNNFLEQIRTLSDLQAQCFILHHFCKSSIEEVAERLDVSTGKVERQLEWAYGKVF